MNEQDIFIGGAFPSDIDERDFPYKKILTQAGPLSPQFEIDYSGQEVLNQGKKGICTAISICQMVEKMYGIKLSYAFLYRVGKKFIDGNTTEGSAIRSMLKAAQKYGLPRYELAPYDINQSYADFMNMPDFAPEVYADALKHKIGSYAPVPVEPVALMEAMSNTPYGLITRMEVGKEWYTAPDGRISWADKDIDPLRRPQVVISGHAILNKGYDARTADIKFHDRNTWGATWADNGEAWFYFKEYAGFFTEAWVISDVDAEEIKRLLQVKLSLTQQALDLAKQLLVKLLAKLNLKK